MRKFLKKHNKIITVAIGVGLIATLDWSWSNVKSFLSGGIIAFYIWLLFANEVSE